LSYRLWIQSNAALPCRRVSTRRGAFIPPPAIQFVTAPPRRHAEPTVRPPSRIAKRRPFSMAIGQSSRLRCDSIAGITISTPAGNDRDPSHRWCGSRTAAGTH